MLLKSNSTTDGAEHSFTVEADDDDGPFILIAAGDVEYIIDTEADADELLTMVSDAVDKFKNMR